MRGWFWVEIFWIVWNRNLCLDKTFEMNKFEIKTMCLWDKRNSKRHLIVVELQFNVTKRYFTVEKYLEWLFEKQTNILIIF